MMPFNRKSLNRTSAPAKRVVSLEEMKNLLRLEEDFIDDDALIIELIKASEDAMERYCKRSFITQTWKLTMDYITSNEVNLPRLPIQTISSVVTYDTANASSTYDSSLYTLDGQAGRLYLDESAQWPTSLRARSAVEITFVAGYGTNPADVPEPIRLAVKSYAAKLYDSRGGCEMPAEVMALLEGFRLLDDLGML